MIIWLYCVLTPSALFIQSYRCKLQLISATTANYVAARST